MGGITGAAADNIRFAGDTTAFMWPSWNTIQPKEGSGARGRVRHMEMHIESQDIGRACCRGSEIPVSAERTAAMTHTYHITGKFTLVHAFPWAGGIVPSFSRKHILSSRGICVGQGVLCPVRAELMFYLQKISAKVGLALPSGELTDNMESIKF